MSDPWLEQFEARRTERKQRAESDRTLIVEGESLIVKTAVAPEIAFAFSDFSRRINEEGLAARDAEAKGEEAPAGTITDRDMVDASEEAIRACLEPASLEAWRRLRASEHPNPLTTLDIYLIADRLLAKAAGLPTAAPTDSSNGRTNIEPSSKAAPRSRARARKA